MTELPKYGTILVATDGSDYAMRAESHALALARATGARLEGVYVVDRNAASQLGPLSGEALAEMNRDGQHVLDALAARAHQAGVSVGVRLLDGRVGPTIIGEAERSDADLLVVGSHGQGALLDALLGSVSLYLVHHSHVPVCVVRPPRP